MYLLMHDCFSVLDYLISSHGVLDVWMGSLSKLELNSVTT